MTRIQTKLTGNYYCSEEAKQFVKGSLTNGSYLFLEPEPTNAVDKNAIKVLNEDDLHIGYIAKEDAEAIGKLLKLDEDLEIKWLGKNKLVVSTLSECASDNLNYDNSLDYMYSGIGFEDIAGYSDPIPVDTNYGFDDNFGNW